MYRNHSTNSQFSKTMTEEQFDRVVDAILSGKYSWACLLILRFAGYNPLHYIPHRTYNRLMKNYREGNFQQAEIPNTNRNTNRSYSRARKTAQNSSKLRDLCYMEEIDRQSAKIKGGIRAFPIGLIRSFSNYKFKNI